MDIINIDFSNSKLLQYCQQPQINIQVDPCFLRNIIKASTVGSAGLHCQGSNADPALCILIDVKVKVFQSRPTLRPRRLQPARCLCPRNSAGNNTGVGSCSFLQGILPTQGSNPGLPHCRWILYRLSHDRGPRKLEWVSLCLFLLTAPQSLKIKQD